MAKAKASGNGEGPSRMQMVRDGLGELGSDAKPQELHAHIKAKHNVDVPKQIISSYKSLINKQSNGGGGRGRKGGGSGALRVEDFETVRGLVSRLGSATVRRLVAAVE